VAETLRWLRLAFRSRRSIQAENLFLRRQLALYIERGVKPRQIGPVTRIGLILLSRPGVPCYGGAHVRRSAGSCKE
jgi:hypothetical protein